ncbi:recombinase family protein [Bacillus sp. JJ1562]|uniref:recombinase family protein n=1 Tax=Bacillus sp. JJ1562 TaxID=3122960 RepID=UPI003001BC48
MKQTAVFYLRLMDNSKVERELSKLNSLQICNEFNIVDQPIIEVGGSYNTLVFKRREIKRLLNLVRTKKLDAVICKNLNNLSRYPLEQIAVEKALNNINCKLISADIDTPNVDELEELKAAIVNFYFPRKEENLWKKQ